MRSTTSQSGALFFNCSISVICGSMGPLQGSIRPESFHSNTHMLLIFALLTLIPSLAYNSFPEAALLLLQNRLKAKADMQI